MFADSLPDDFGNQIFNTWVKEENIDTKKLSPILQLAYVSDRGMGALEYFPGKILPRIGEVDLDDITAILGQVLEVKDRQNWPKLDTLGLLNIFKMGTSAGGARPKVIVSEDRESGVLLAGDVKLGKGFDHYLVKLGMGGDTYSREIVEFAYYRLALGAGLEMMPSKMIDDRHFATLRYDRIDGKKVHVLTATGISGHNYRDPGVSSYENLFEIAHTLNLPSADMDALFRRMVFNRVYHNTDDHLKNHSFLYEPENDRWRITPSYDINFTLDALAKWPNAPHQLSLNGKRSGVEAKDVLALAGAYSIKGPKRIIEEVCAVLPQRRDIAGGLKLPDPVSSSIADEFKPFGRLH